MVKARTTPYFEGQKQERCGHYYPDVLRVIDRLEEGIAVRTLECVECGRYNITLPHRSIKEEREPSKEELETTRVQERARLLSP
jgi:hypothetical protein